MQTTASCDLGLFVLRPQLHTVLDSGQGFLLRAGSEWPLAVAHEASYPSSTLDLQSSYWQFLRFLKVSNWGCFPLTHSGATPWYHEATYRSIGETHSRRARASGHAGRAKASTSRSSAAMPMCGPCRGTRAKRKRHASEASGNVIGVSFFVGER